MVSFFQVLWSNCRHICRLSVSYHTLCHLALVDLTPLMILGEQYQVFGQTIYLVYGCVCECKRWGRFRVRNLHFLRANGGVQNTPSRITILETSQDLSLSGSYRFISVEKCVFLTHWIGFWVDSSADLNWSVMRKISLLACGQSVSSAHLFSIFMSRT
jgi:hypothetical protein